MERTSWVTWRLFLITLPVDVFAVVFLSSRTEISRDNIHYLILLAIVSHCATAPFFPAGIRISKRFNDWKSDLLVLITLGTIRGFAILFFDRAVEIPNTVIDEFRILNSAIAFPTWFIFFALVTEAKHQYQKEFNSLFRQMVESVDNANQREKKGVSSSEILINRLQSITSKLGSEIEQVLDASTHLSDYTHESQRIQDLIDGELRPTSKRLWQDGTFKTPAIRAIDMLRIVLLEQKLLVNLAVLFSAPFLAVGVTGPYGINVALIQTTVAVLPIIISNIFIERIRSRNLISRTKSNLLILGMGWLIPIPLQFAVVPEEMRLTRGVFEFLIYQTSLWLVLVTLLIGCNLYYLINNQRAAVLQSIKSLLDDEKYISFIALESNSTRDVELSRYLHGEIQTGLTVAVLLLQQASRSGDSVLARQALENAVKILNQNHIEGYKRSLSSNEIHLAQIVSGWRGIADVDISLKCLSQIPKGRVRDVVELIAEGVTNAIRHGRATKVIVFDEEEESLIRLHIRSNATELPKGKSGLGTEMFNQLALNWEFVGEAGESKLTFSVSKDQ